MATPSAPSCEIRRVIVHFYPDGLKGGAHPCEQQFFGRRGKPVSPYTRLRLPFDKVKDKKRKKLVNKK